MKKIAGVTRFLGRNVLVVLLKTPKVLHSFFFFFFTAWKCHVFSGTVEPSARMQVDFVGATPSRENQMEMLKGPPARWRVSPGKRMAGVYAELDTASFFRWSMKTCRLTSSVRMGAPVS